MRISISGKGIHRREVPGVDKLRTLPSHWYAFTNLELIQAGSMPRQIDIVIVLDDRIIIADLKDWNGKITSDGDRWLQNDRVVDTSPVKKILENTRIMAGLLTRFLPKHAARTGSTFHRRDVPLIEGCVVLTGRCDISMLPDLEKPRVFPIDEFCRVVQNTKERNQRFAHPTWVHNREQLTDENSVWRSRLNSFFGEVDYFRPLDRRFGDYRVISDEVYQHPKELYREYDAEEVSASRGFGLLRLWDFSKADPRYASEEARMQVAGREHDVINYLVDRQPDLESVLFRPKLADPTKGIHYWEIYERRRQLQRLNQFLATHFVETTPAARLQLARTLLSHVAGMHRLGAAHLDLGDHSIWLELPSIVRLSHLLAASYPELATLGERRYEFLATPTILPESVLGNALDHFRKDVFLLGVIVHKIIFGIPPNCKGIADPPHWDSSLDLDGRFDYLYGWFEKCLDIACAQRFGNAQEMLDAFNEAIRSAAGGPNAIERLQRYRRWKSVLELYKEFPPQRVLKETDRVTAWRSETSAGKFLVKAWRRSCWADESLEAPRLVRFCEAAEDLILATPPGTVRIVDVGYIGEFLVLIQEFVEAPNLHSHLETNPETWGEARPVVDFIERLVKVVVSLHEAGRCHGDLKPSNILVTNTELGPSPVLVDLLDFGPADEGERRTPAYSPAQDVGTRERDRYAVLKIAEKLLEHAAAPPTAEPIQQAIATCRHHSPALSTLAPLSEAIEHFKNPPPIIARKTLVLRSTLLTPGRVAPDEGRYYVGLRPRSVTITGATEELVLVLDKFRKGEIFDIRRQTIPQSQVDVAEKMAKFQLHDDIVIETGLRDFSPLNAVVQSLLAEPQLTAAPLASGTVDGLTQEVESAATKPLEEDAIADLEVEPAPQISVDVPALWKTLLQVEDEQFTEGVVDSDSYYSRDKRRHFVAFQVRKGTLDFTREDKVLVEVATRKKGWAPIGILDLDLTRNELIAVDASQYRAREGGMLCSAGTELRFMSMMETDSRSRRNAATSRLLERKAIVPNLVDYFCPATPVEYIDATASINIDSIREKYGLNHSQAAAFGKLWSKRPLGLLQGPPGTGKTKFIAALVHYALSNGNVRNVLLSSQSHEAVNNATESVLKLFRNDGIEPSLVRIGQEGNVSELLKPYHSAKVEEHYREQFRAGLKQRFRVAGRHIGLPIGFSDDLFFMESTLRPVLTNLHALAGTDPSGIEDSYRRRRVSSLRRTLLDLAETVGILTLSADDWMDSNAYERAIDAIAGKNNIDSPEFVRRMRGIATLASDWMGSVTSRRRSFEEFLAKTRQIVAGTCVGLGRSSLGLTSARFDLVVVDEAARCTPSELAVPVQAGRWILLVGDHCQLEPFHQPVVIRETQRRLKIPTKDVIRSDFERAFASVHGRRFGQTLLTQYRMLPAIGKLISDAFYDGRLDHGRKKPILPDDVCPVFLQRQLVWVCTDSLDEKAFQTRQRNTGRSLANHVEANAIVDILRRLDDHQPFVDWLAHYDDDRKPIGIICTYAAQRELIRQKLGSVGLSGTLLKSCKIDTVDSYQGKENPLVILSLVRNNADGHLELGERTIAQGFMARANRINVGLSRAMDRLIIVGASQRWPSDSPMARVASLFERLYDENLAEFLAPSRFEDLPRRAKGTRQRIPLKESTNDEGGK